MVLDDLDLERLWECGRLAFFFAFVPAVEERTSIPAGPPVPEALLRAQLNCLHGAVFYQNGSRSCFGQFLVGSRLASHC